MPFTSLTDCQTQVAAACLVIQNGFAYVAANTSTDLSGQHEKAYKAALSAEQALGLAVGTFSNPDGGTNKPPSQTGSAITGG